MCLKGQCQVRNWVRFSECSCSAFIYWCIYSLNFTYLLFESRKAESLRWKAVFAGIIVDLTVIFLPFIFFLSSSVKEEQKTWQVANRERDCYISYVQPNICRHWFAFWESLMTAMKINSLSPFTFHALSDLCFVGRGNGRLVQVSVMCWILMRWQLWPAPGAFLKCCLQH